MIPGNRKILITGSRGMLGSDLLLEGQRLYGAENIFPTSSEQLDVTDAQAVFKTLKEIRPAVLLNAAAYTNVDGAETETEKNIRANADGPQVLTEACRELKIKLVHFSTDYIYSGEVGPPWTEGDEPNPVSPNAYAHAKLEGERSVQSYENALILRVQWLYGKSKDKFAAVKQRAVFTPFIDQVGTPTWTREVARAVYQLLERGVTGTYNFSYDDPVSWYEVYQLLKERWNLSVELVPKRLAEVNLPARRPANCAMSNKKLSSALGISSMGSWKTPFLEYLK